MNCWEALRAEASHSVAGNGKREGQKIARIGQSAAKGLGSLEPANVFSQPLNLDDVLFGHGMASARHDLVALNRGYSLGFLSPQERKSGDEQVVSECVAVDDFVGGFAGRKNSGLNVPSGLIGEEVDGVLLAHRNFDHHSKLEAMRGSVLGRKFADPDTAFTVNNSGDVRRNGLVHISLWSTFNDYPEMEYGEAPGSVRPSHLTKNETDDIVFSARKRAAACKKRRRICAPSRKYKAYTNDDYVGIAWPTTLRALKNTLETIHQYTVPGIQLIFNGEIGRYENTRFVEQTNIVKGISTDGATGTAWASTNDWIFFMGEDTVAEGVAVPEEMRAKIPTDYGRSKGVAWYYLGGFGIVQTAASESRIVVWDSAV